MTRARPIITERVTAIGLAIVGGAIALFAAIAAQAAWRAIEAHPRTTGAPVAVTVETPPKVGHALDPLAAPAAGATGTIALPPLPPAATLDMAEAGVVAARPFSLVGVPRVDRGRALNCLTAAIYYEAASEPDAGQQAVAQVVLNRVRHPAFPNTVCGVVYQGSAHAGCQFSFACDGAMRRMPSIAGWAHAARVAAAALAGRVYAPIGLATHYHTAAVTPAWNRALVMTDAVGAHFFHRWKGWWGTPAAFTQHYVGSEPMPKPVVPPKLPDLVAIALAPPSIDSSDVHPAYRASGTPVAAATAADRLPPPSTVLDRWKDSGQPLR